MGGLFRSLELEAQEGGWACAIQVMKTTGIQNNHISVLCSGLHKSYHKRNKRAVAVLPDLWSTKGAMFWSPLSKLPTRFHCSTELEDERLQQGHRRLELLQVHALVACLVSVDQARGNNENRK